jgi:uracil-DNA glycosylase family 4
MVDPRTLRVLRQHVWTDRLLGAEAVPVGDTVDIPAQSASAQPPAADVAASPHRSTPSPASVGRPAFVATAAVERGRLFGVAASPPVEFRVMDRQTKLKVLDDMDRNEVRSCTRCDLCHHRTQTVFGEGDVDAKLMFVGEGPGQQEDEQGRPFVGRSGTKLTEMIVAMGLTREQVYIANVVKCRPPDNRTPTPLEAETCGQYLKRQIAAICPTVIVTLGGPAAKLLLATTTGITALRGTWQSYTGLQPDGPVIPVMPTFHPAYLLRNYTRENRARVWSDLQAAMKRFQGET